MKTTFKKNLLAFAVLAVVCSSCKKNDTLNANLDLIDKNITAPTAIDAWLTTNYLDPYNIQVKYKYDRFELELGKDITPPMEDKIIPTMDVVKDMWIHPYETAGGATFIKRISPKQFILAGSANYEVDGNQKAGTAEAGRKVVLYVVNNFDKNSESAVTEMLHVIHHEYTHILNQTVNFQPDFQLVSRGGYLTAYLQESLQAARDLGFITQYSRKSPQEDYAEMTSNMLMMGRIGFNAAVNTASADGIKKLKQKEQFVVDYFKTAFNIDFYGLQTAVQERLHASFPVTFAGMLGYGVGYTTLTSAPSTDPKQSVDFLGLWNAANVEIGKKGFALTGYKLTFKADNTVTITYSTIRKSDKNVFFADVDYDLATQDDFVQFTVKDTQPTTTTYGNADYFNSALAPLNGYFSDTFQVDWFNKVIPGPIGTIGSLGVFYKAADKTSYFYGAMGQ